MSKFIFSVCILLGLLSQAAGQDPNMAKNADPKVSEASAPQVPCEGCGGMVAHPIPQVEQLNLDLTKILKGTEKGLSATINGEQPQSGVLQFKSNSKGKELRDLLKFHVGEGTIEIKKKGFIYRRQFSQ